MCIRDRAKVEAETLGDKLGDVETEALVDKVGDTLPEVEGETLGDKLGDVETKALVDTRWQRWRPRRFARH